MTQSLVDTLLGIPATPAITFRGMSGPEPSTSITVQRVLPSSLDPRFASENFTAARLAAIVTITGRYIAPLSRNPDEQEIAILPGTLLLRAGFVEVDGVANRVVLFAEPGSAPGLPADSQQLREVVRERVTAALRSPEVVIHSPGRFTPQSAS